MSRQFSPTTLSDFQVFFLDESWGGVLNKLTLPDIELKTESFTASATGGEKDKVLPIMKALKPKLNFSDINAKILALVGNPTGKDEPLILRGSMDRDGVPVGVKITMQGDWFKASHGELASGGQEANTELEGSLDLYSIEIDGKASLYVDLINRVYKPDGVTDVWEKLRANIGL